MVFFRTSIMLPMAAFGRALYYPHVDLDNDDWLKGAALYYDGISRIVPDGVEPRDSDVARCLIDEADFVRPLSPVHDANETASEFLNYALKYLKDADYRNRLEKAMAELIRDFPVIRIYAAKLSDSLRNELPRLGLAYKPDADKSEHWEEYEFQRPVTGAMYMACLANRMASVRAVPVVSDHPSYQWLIRGMQDESSPYAENEDKGYLLGSAVIESVIPKNIANIDIKDIVAFRAKHEAERHRFYTAVNGLAKDIPKIQDADSLRDCLEFHKKTINDGVRGLELSLKGVGIDCVRGFMGLSVPAWAATAMVQSALHIEPLAAATNGGPATACGILAMAGNKRYTTKQNSPYSYVLSIQGKFQRKSFFGN